MPTETARTATDRNSLARRELLRALRPVDCDLHPVPPTMKQLPPYLDTRWRDSMVSCGIGDVSHAVIGT